MIKKPILVGAIVLFVVAGSAAADEFDAVFDNSSRATPKNFKQTDTFYFRTFTLDSKGRSVAQSGLVGKITKDTKANMGVLDKKTKKWVAGEAIEGGAAAPLFTEDGPTLRLLVTMTDGKIQRILVTDPDWKIVHADGPVQAIYKAHGAFTNGRGPISYVRLDVDDKGKVIKYLGQTTGIINANTKVAMGKYNKEEKTWEAGAEIPNGVYGDLFKDPGAKNIYVQITYRTDGGGIAEMLVLQIGDKGKK